MWKRRSGWYAVEQGGCGGAAAVARRRRSIRAAACVCVRARMGEQIDRHDGDSS